MSRVYVGNLNSQVSNEELEIKFSNFGIISKIWVARRPPSYAFINFVYIRDAESAIRELDDKNGWRVEFSHNSRQALGQYCTNGNIYVTTKHRAGGEIGSSHQRDTRSREFEGQIVSLGSDICKIKTKSTTTHCSDNKF
ncbi:serine/arginine-rich splicing factor RSZ22A-like [Argentina anserina]|uniref:serine/arginine-rich splicing factor RSZ22A-like n=1 Tax=Argentina anserina TaxID=57926 RepID=UPI0021763EFF|nr:serine/arginine-rich splicing factor RSZ22A-like [Potentilla anserina]